MTEMVLSTEDLKKKIDLLKSEVSETQTKSQNTVGVLIGVISDMVGGLLVGSGIGVLCVKFLGWIKISFAVFLILGGIAGILNIYRFLKKEDKPDA
ncbi:MAG: hypothetical protein J6U64_01640 [Alphaproteobacteria bacterium]|nr:hypothetical protein [Alphaproteobacteria bacterium]